LGTIDMKNTSVRLDPNRVAEIAECLKKSKGGDVALTDVMVLAELMVGSMQDFFRSLDSSVYGELREKADYITRAKDEISQLGAKDINENRIPTAGRELDEIVKSTEEATHMIMEQAELIMDADASDPQAYAATVNGAVMQIFEACSFQDLTGQRISKIVETLAFIDRRVSRFAQVIGMQDHDSTLSQEEAAREARRTTLLLHGPQAAGVGVSQDAVDDLLEGKGDRGAGNGAATSQSEIDALFD
jgi:chemotaxis protein CheZ